MSLLARRFRETVSKSKNKAMKIESTGNVCYPTGFIMFDFLNGYITHVENEEKGIHEKYYSVGIQDGTLNMFIGRSQSGKTTFAMQTAFHIISQYKTSAFFHDDVEGGINDARKRVLTGESIGKLKQRYICRDTGVHTEDFYDRIKIIYEEKMNNYDDYVYDTGKLDESGNPLFKLEPTVYLLDSFAMLKPLNIDDKDVSNNMTAAGATKVNTEVLRRIIPMLKAANIILFVINHILQDISIMPKAAALRFLKPGERLSGGETLILLANNTIRFADKKLQEKDGLGIEGAFIDVSLVKSRQNIAGRSVTMAFDFNTGYNNALSILLLLKQNNMINGSGIGLYIGDRNDRKFSQKKFISMFDKKNDPEFYSIVMNACMPILKDMVNQNEATNVMNDATGDFNDDLLDAMNDMLKAS